MVSERTQKRHCKLDAEGKFCSAKFVVDRHASNCIDDRRQAIGTGVQVSRQTQWRDRRSQLYRALMGAQADPDYGAHGFPDYMDFDDIGRLPPMQYGIHMMPRTKLPLDEAIYRETWKLQSMLDEAKMPQELQDRILKMLYGGKKEPPCRNGITDSDFSGRGLGDLLRHAGPSWQGGRHGIEAFSSFKGLCSTFDQYGMPKTQRWRMCLGCKNKWHAPEVLRPSHQDDYNVSTGVKCQCSNRTSNPQNRWFLARDCAECSERCPHVECAKARKDMIRFEYFPIGPMLRKLCSSRSICHELQAMWRDKQNWFRQDSRCRAKPIYKEWWDGSRASELSYFWDSANEFQLPVLCRNCYKCYATLPMLCEELCDPGNWDESANQYILQCTECGSRVTSPRKSTKVSNLLCPGLCVNLPSDQKRIHCTHEPNVNQT